MMKNIDFCLFVYSVIVLSTLYGYVFFSWWQRKSGEGSEMYVLVKLLLLCMFINYATQLYARTIFLLDFGSSDRYDSIVSSFWWHIRALPVAGILFIFLYKLTKRARRTVARLTEFDNRFPPVEDRRHEKRREEDRNK